MKNKVYSPTELQTMALYLYHRRNVKNLENDNISTDSKQFKRRNKNFVDNLKRRKTKLSF